MRNFRHIFYVKTKIYVDFVDICRSVYFQICVSVPLSFKDIFSKCDQIRGFLWTWSPLRKKSLMKNIQL